jgi:molybdate/tungstate transport system substrate-binding protein
MHRGTIAGFLLFTASCADHGVAPDTLIVYEAASLAGPMRAVRDTFARRTGVVVLEEHGASLELARRITELHRIPDVIALADHEVFSEQLRPATVWYAAFARNRMVVAYTSRSRYANEVTADNWRSILLRPDALVGRTDPVLAPAGYRALLVYRLAESYYHDAGLAARLEARTPPRQLRGNAADLAALLSAGELDYIIEYESLARAQNFKFVALPAAIDLGDAAQAATYATAFVRVGNGRDSITRRGAPILYGVSVPSAAPHAATGVRYVAFLLGAEGQAMLRAAHVDALARPWLVGEFVPPALRAVSAP